MTFLKFTWLAWSVAIVWFSLLFVALAVACGGGQANDALLQAYGECLYGKRCSPTRRALQRRRNR